MNKQILVAFAFAVLCTPHRACAQFNDARAYDNTPVGTNQLELKYSHVHANASLDPSLIISDASLNAQQGIIDYMYYFNLFHHLAWVEAGVPLAGLRGSVAGTNVHSSTNGAGDSSYQFATLLKGGQALSVRQFDSYKPTMSLGLSLGITAPTGAYTSSKILNLGSGRWSFKPELAFTNPFGADHNWEFDLYANVSFYTDNTSYHGREVLHQQPLPGIEGHISYAFNDKVWVSVDTRYSFRGVTFVNEVSQNNSQQNLILGSELNVSLSAQNSVTFEFAEAVVHRYGPAVTGFSIKYDYTWSWHRLSRNQIVR